MCSYQVAWCDGWLRVRTKKIGHHFPNNTFVTSTFLSNTFPTSNSSPASWTICTSATSGLLTIFIHILITIKPFSLHCLHHVTHHYHQYAMRVCLHCHEISLPCTKLCNQIAAERACVSWATVSSLRAISVLGVLQASWDKYRWNSLTAETCCKDFLGSSSQLCLVVGSEQKTRCSMPFWKRHLQEKCLVNWLDSPPARASSMWMCIQWALVLFLLLVWSVTNLKQRLSPPTQYPRMYKRYTSSLNWPIIISDSFKISLILFCQDILYKLLECEWFIHQPEVETSPWCWEYCTEYFHIDRHSSSVQWKTARMLRWPRSRNRVAREASSRTQVDVAATNHLLLWKTRAAS